MIFCRTFFRDSDGTLKTRQRKWPDSDWLKAKAWLESWQESISCAEGGYLWLEGDNDPKDEVILASIPYRSTNEGDRYDN